MYTSITTTDGQLGYGIDMYSVGNDLIVSEYELLKEDYDYDEFDWELEIKLSR